MGQLIAMKYPTKLALKAADHTYVECGGGGKGWSCWGGKSGGTAFNVGNGSTNRADKIAEPNERAGITCYLVNGVCHQAANRVLFPARILVTAARGYPISSLVFGAYGKSALRPCYSQFNQHPGVTGDLSNCTSGTTAVAKKNIATFAQPKTEQTIKHVLGLQKSYLKFQREEASAIDSMNFQIDLFMKEITFKLGTDLSSRLTGLRNAKVSLELEHWKLADALQKRDMNPVEFIKSFNEMTSKLQDDIANVLPIKQYNALTGLQPNERVFLADPEIIDRIYGAGTAIKVYGASALR